MRFWKGSFFLHFIETHLILIRDYLLELLSLSLSATYLLLTKPLPKQIILILSSIVSEICVGLKTYRERKHVKYTKI